MFAGPVRSNAPKRFDTVRQEFSSDIPNYPSKPLLGLSSITAGSCHGLGHQFHVDEKGGRQKPLCGRRGPYGGLAVHAASPADHALSPPRSWRISIQIQ